MKKKNKKHAASKQARLKQKSSDAIFGFAKAATTKAERLFPKVTKSDFAELALGINGDHVSASRHHRAGEMKIVSRILKVIISEGKDVHASNQSMKRLSRLERRCANTYTWFVARAGEHVRSGSSREAASNCAQALVPAQRDCSVVRCCLSVSTTSEGRATMIAKLAASDGRIFRIRLPARSALSKSPPSNPTCSSTAATGTVC